MAAGSSPREGASWGEAPDQVERGGLGGPFPFDGDGQLLTSGGPQSVNPASGFGVKRKAAIR